MSNWNQVSKQLRAYGCDVAQITSHDRRGTTWIVVIERHGHVYQGEADTLDQAFVSAASQLRQAIAAPFPGCEGPHFSI